MMALLRRLFGRVGQAGDIPLVIGLVWALIGIGLFSLLIPAWAQKISHGWAAALTVFSAGLFLAGAATVTGSLVGFMFGVPRYRRTDRDAQAADQNTTAPNTNLEQISDWLTKIIVGVGLTQIPQISRFFQGIGDQWGAAFGPPPSGPLIAISMTIHYLVMGFFQGFLLSSLWLPGALDRARGERRGLPELPVARPVQPEAESSAAGTRV